MVGVVRKIIAEATGIETESSMPPLIEFFGPNVLKVCTFSSVCNHYVNTRHCKCQWYIGSHMHTHDQCRTHSSA